MYLNMSSPNPFLAIEETIWISTCVNQTYPMPARTKMYLNLKWPNPSHVSKATESLPLMRRNGLYLNSCWPNPSHANGIQNATQLVLTNVPWQRGQKSISICVDQHGVKMYVNMCWTNSNHASEDAKCNTTCVDQIPLMPVRTQNVSQLEMTKRTPCQRGHKMYHNLCWPIPSHATKIIKCISTCVYQTPPMPARIQIVSWHEISIQIPFQQVH